MAPGERPDEAAPDETLPTVDASSPRDSGPDARSAPSGSSSGSSSGAAPDASDALGPTQCGMRLPAGAAVPPALPVYAGTCPALAAYPAFTELVSGGVTRRFLVLKPSDVAAGETLPVVFAWHWLGGEPEEMVERLGLAAATQALRFIAVVPDPRDDNETFRWPYAITASDGRVAEELAFFDDMLACVAATEPVDDACVSSLGVSAGALFTAQLVMGRSERLASFVSLSGGVGGNLIRGWTSPTHKVPGMVVWGGEDDRWSSDIPILHFDDLSRNLEDGMTSANMGIVECVHDCGHTVPPFETPASGVRFEGIFDFVKRHPYGLADGATSYPTGLPPTLPTWCAVGKGMAVPRVGACP